MPIDDWMYEDDFTRDYEIAAVRVSCKVIPQEIDRQKAKTKLMLDTITTDMDMHIQSAMSVLDTQLTGKLGRKVIETLELAKRT